MSDLRIDYSDLTGLVDEGVRKSEERKQRRERTRRLPLRAGRLAAFAAVLAVLPFAILIRGGVFAYRVWGLPTWLALTVAAAATALLLGGYAWMLTRRFGASPGVRNASPGVRKMIVRAAMGVGVAYVAYALVFVASENVKSEEVQAEYASVHPLLRIAASALILVDPQSVITDAGRTQEDYFLMGLPPNEASLHFEQETGYVHALDLRTNGRPEWRNRVVELAFWAFGFHSLRHVGTADHLHLSLRLPA